MRTLNNKIKIGIGKGRGFKESVEQLRIDDNKLINQFMSENLPVCENDEIILIKIRQSDLAWMLEKGHIDIAIGSSVWFKEYPSALLKSYKKMDLLHCKLCLITERDKTSEDIKHICTKFTSIAKEFIKKEKLNSEIINMQGSHEIALKLGFADAIIDIVETGRTIKEMGFVIAKEIYNINHEIWIRQEDKKTKEFLNSIFCNQFIQN